VDGQKRKLYLMTKKEIIEDLTHKVADIKYDLQVVLDTLYQLGS
jgi:hypothetical protein